MGNTKEKNFTFKETPSNDSQMVDYCIFCSKCGNPKLLHVLCGHCFKETMKLTAEYRRMKEQECKEDDVLNQENNTVSTKQNS